MKNNSKKQAAPRASKGLDGGSVGQIRDILFGEQMSDYEERFNELEASLEKRFEQLKSTLDESVSELKSLVEAKKSGINTRNVSREALADQLAAVADAIRGSGDI